MSGLPGNGIRDADKSRKGRPPIGKKAMTAAQRQRRRRKRLAKVKTIAVLKRVAAKKTPRCTPRCRLGSPIGATAKCACPITPFLIFHGLRQSPWLHVAKTSTMETFSR
jgi:hypothetical protein